MADLFGLEGPPDRIEVYDNSHIQGTDALGAMIVAGPEGFRKMPISKFNIKKPETIAGDDFGMMREVFGAAFRACAGRRSQSKRPANGRTGFWSTAARGQLNAARQIREEFGIEDVPMVGVAEGRIMAGKGARSFTCSTDAELTLPTNHPVLFYLPAAARRGAPFCHRRAPPEAQQGDHREFTGRGSGHRSIPQEGAARCASARQRPCAMRASTISSARGRVSSGCADGLRLFSWMICER